MAFAHMLKGPLNMFCSQQSDLGLPLEKRKHDVIGNLDALVKMH